MNYITLLEQYAQENPDHAEFIDAVLQGTVTRDFLSTLNQPGIRVFLADMAITRDSSLIAPQSDMPGQYSLDRLLELGQRAEVLLLNPQADGVLYADWAAQNGFFNVTMRPEHLEVFEGPYTSDTLVTALAMSGYTALLKPGDQNIR